MNILVNSLPKSGTNLMQKCVELAGLNWSGHSLGASANFGRYKYVKNFLRRTAIGDVPVFLGLDVPVTVSEKWLRRYLRNSKGYVSGHAAYSGHFHEILKLENFKTIQVIRHPCALLSSWASYIVEPGYYWNAVQKNMSGLSFEKRLNLMISGGYLNDLYVTGLRDIFLRAQGWYEMRDDVLVVRYEDLVGSRGGGDDEYQRETIEAVLLHIGISYNDEKVSNIQSQLYGGTVTFRKGHIHAWKDQMDWHLKQSVHDALKDIKILDRFGYFYE
ncbi:sulfotransferase domain-containing protein [Candidatus Villigracilis saccharophilus]|uniref:sulfotransferase domain-containing protein n=1 Tax=Candidatus Villigracilis saccharophilus TaxID=3140684 RepID=UPI0031368EDB|nr:sulfotransferase domain-containing protein [Anaerolineales bacterium]